MTVSTYRDLEVWQRAMDVGDDIYDVIRYFPDYERFELASQLRRAAVSVPANIAEGRGRATTREFLHHLSIAGGSLAETQTLVLAAARRRYITQAGAEAFLAQADSLARQINALRTALKNKLRPNPQPLNDRNPPQAASLNANPLPSAPTPNPSSS